VKYRGFDVYRGGRNQNGQDLAFGGQATNQGLASFKNALAKNPHPSIVVVAFTGTNDYRQHSKDMKTAETLANISAMVKAAWDSGACVLLIRFPPPNKTGIFAPEEKDRYTFVAAVNKHYETLYAQYSALDPKRIGFVRDYYAPLRVNGTVPKTIVEDGVHVKKDAVNEKKLFDHVMGALKPLMDHVGATRFTTKDLVDESHWWRQNDWFKSQIFSDGKEGKWLSYWTGDDWKKETAGLQKDDQNILELYSKRIADTHYSYKNATNQADKNSLYERLSELLEYWWLGSCLVHIRGTTASMRR